MVTGGAGSDDGGGRRERSLSFTWRRVDEVPVASP